MNKIQGGDVFVQGSKHVFLRNTSNFSLTKQTHFLLCSWLLKIIHEFLQTCLQSLNCIDWVAPLTTRHLLSSIHLWCFTPKMIQSCSQLYQHKLAGGISFFDSRLSPAYSSWRFEAPRNGGATSYFRAPAGYQGAKTITRPRGCSRTRFSIWPCRSRSRSYRWDKKGEWRQHSAANRDEKTRQKAMFHLQENTVLTRARMSLAIRGLISRIS